MPRAFGNLSKASRGSGGPSPVGLSPGADRAEDSMAGQKDSSLRGALSLSLSFMSKVTSSRQASWVGLLFSSQAS